MSSVLSICRRRQVAFVAALAALLLLLPLSSTCRAQNSEDKKKATKEICITFDELPAAKSFGDVDRTAVTYLILETLKKHKVKAAGFVIGDQIGESFDILGEWLNNGHVLGNMTFSNQDLNELGIEQFITDIRTGHEALEMMLDNFGQKKRYFRYPFLHYGNTVESKREVALFLEAHEYIVAHASVITEDYLYNLSFDKLGKTPDTAAYDDLMNEYVNHVLDQIDRSEKLSLEVLNRPCKQILQLRANRLNAVFLDVMLTAIEDAGYKFISLDQALKDKLYTHPEAYYGNRGVGYLDMILGSDPDLLPAE